MEPYSNRSRKSFLAKDLWSMLLAACRVASVVPVTTYVIEDNPISDQLLTFVQVVISGRRPKYCSSIWPWPVRR